MTSSCDSQFAVGNHLRDLKKKRKKFTRDQRLLCAIQKEKGAYVGATVIRTSYSLVMI